MAKMKLSENTFTLIPEGVTTFKIMEVEDKDYEDFGIIVVKLQTAKGEKHQERFTLINATTGEVNDGALRAWSYFARTCLQDSNVDEIDTQDIVGKYITATVTHEKYTRTKGEKAGQEATTVRLKDYVEASSFESEIAENDDLDDLDDLEF